MKLIIAIFITTLSINGYTSHPNESFISELKKKIPQTWYKCEKDDECIVTSGPCSYPIVINKRFSGMPINKDSRETKIPHCIDFMGPKWPNKAVCNKGACEGKWD